jgi:hypothetical protein
VAASIASLLDRPERLPSEMKVVEPVRAFMDRERVARWSYLAFTLLSLYMVRRAKNDRIPSEVRAPLLLSVCVCSH